MPERPSDIPKVEALPVIRWYVGSIEQKLLLIDMQVGLPGDVRELIHNLMDALEDYFRHRLPDAATCTLGRRCPDGSCRPYCEEVIGILRHGRPPD